MELWVLQRLYSTILTSVIFLMNSLSGSRNHLLMTLPTLSNMNPKLHSSSASSVGPMNPSPLVHRILCSITARFSSIAAITLLSSLFLMNALQMPWPHIFLISGKQLQSPHFRCCSFSSQKPLWNAFTTSLCPFASTRCRGGGLGVAAASGEARSTQGLLEVWQSSQGLGRLGKLGRVVVVQSLQDWAQECTLKRRILLSKLSTSLHS